MVREYERAAVKQYVRATTSCVMKFFDNYVNQSCKKNIKTKSKHDRHIISRKCILNSSELDSKIRFLKHLPKE